MAEFPRLLAIWQETIRKGQKMNMEKVTVRTTDDIKLGLKCCIGDEAECEICPYQKETFCFTDVKRDALGFINQHDKVVEVLTNKITALCEDIKQNGARDMCCICLHYESEIRCDVECDKCKKPCACNSCFDYDKWEWRGE